MHQPESIEQIARSVLLLARVLAQVQKLEHVSVPGLKVDGKRTRTLETTCYSNRIFYRINHRIILYLLLILSKIGKHVTLFPP